MPDALCCTNCCAPLSGGLDTFGSYWRPVCFDCRCETLPTPAKIEQNRQYVRLKQELADAYERLHNVNARQPGDTDHCLEAAMERIVQLLRALDPDFDCVDFCVAVFYGGAILNAAISAIPETFPAPVEKAKG